MKCGRVGVVAAAGLISAILVLVPGNAAAGLGPSSGAADPEIEGMLRLLRSMESHATYTVTEEYLKVQGGGPNRINELQGVVISALRDLREQDPSFAYDILTQIVDYAMEAAGDAPWPVLAQAAIKRRMRVNSQNGYHMMIDRAEGTRNVILDGSTVLDYHDYPGGRLTVRDAPVMERVPTLSEIMSPLPVWNEEVRAWLLDAPWRRQPRGDGLWLEYIGDDPVRYWVAAEQAGDNCPLVSWRQFDLHENHLKVFDFTEEGSLAGAILVNTSPASVSLTRWTVTDLSVEKAPFPLGLVLRNAIKLQDLRGGRRDVYAAKPATWPAEIRDVYLFFEDSHTSPGQEQSEPDEVAGLGSVQTGSGWMQRRALALGVLAGVLGFAVFAYRKYVR